MACQHFTIIDLNFFLLFDSFNSHRPIDNLVHDVVFQTRQVKTRLTNLSRSSVT